MGGDVIRVRAVGGSVDAVVPHGASEGDVFMAEYHPERSRSPECRVTFEIDQRSGNRLVVTAAHLDDCRFQATPSSTWSMTTLVR